MTSRDSSPMRIGKPCEALAEGAEVLAAEQGRRHHHRHLPAVHGGDEGGAQRHLGLAEADVAADQPVGRPAAAEVLQHVADGARLIVGLGPGKAGAELVEQALGRRQARRLADGAARRRCGSARPPSRAAAASSAPCAPASRRRRAGRGRRPRSPSRSGRSSRCSRPAGTGGRRRRRGCAGNRAARRRPTPPPAPS